MLENNQKYKLRPADEWLLKTKFKGKYIIDWFEKEKLDKCLICDKKDIARIGTDEKEIVTCFNQVFIILKKSLIAKLKPDDEIEIKRILKKYAERRARNLNNDGTITNDYKNLLSRAHKNRFKQIIPIDSPKSKVPMEKSVGRGIIKGHDNEMSEKKKNDIRKGLADMMGTRSASNTPN